MYTVQLTDHGYNSLTMFCTCLNCLHAIVFHLSGFINVFIGLLKCVES